jgi:hypothetical protein
MLVEVRALGLALVLAIGVAGRAARAGPDPYRTLDELDARLRALAAAHPDRARVRPLATTREGREVLALEVDLDGAFADDAAVVLVHGAVHGGEWVSAEVVLHLAELAVAARDDALRGVRLHFVPVVNADGFAAGIRGTLDADGVTLYDVNRDFPVPGAGDTPSRPVAAALRAYARRGRLAAVLDYHSDAEAYSWPWAHTRRRAPASAAVLAPVVEEMARAVGYRFGQTSRIIDYPHKGTAQDYFADAHGVPAILMELGAGSPTAERLVQDLIDQERPFRIFVAWLKATRAAASSPPADTPASSPAPR